jgi:hypothetical protein
MSVQTVKKAARLHLAALSPELPTAYEAYPFDAPSSELYQRTQFVVTTPDDPVIGDRYYRERVEFQVFVVGPAGVGTSKVDTRAELIRNHFYKGLTLIQDGMRIYVLRTPQIAGTTVVQDKVIIPVLIDLVGEVYS